MCLSLSSLSQIPVTISNESHTTSVISQTLSAENTTRPQPDSPSSPNPPAPPTPPAPSLTHHPISAMPAIQPKLQSNSPLQNLATTSIPPSSNSSVILPEPAASLQCDRRVKVSSQPLDSGIVDTVSLSSKPRQAITPSFSYPGAFTAANKYEHTFPDSADSHCALNGAPSTESISDTSQQTPNVYINGLPPHFSEQNLFALARPFGNIKSVRTFTRHVSEKPTGYGFVLFSDVESAQRCIEGLRKCRNLHPSFSKQVHRIPGTEYAQHSLQSTDQDEHSFKSRMEKLKDPASTNLYIEGLPLSIDEESLSALVKPYNIKSSRFFKTKLSNPPRIIAFVRLETRAAAEGTIERLHGRMVRGWNDPGCRISVRFADSAEQRELRRAERTLKNGDQSPSRLTIAQAALLNLRGQELQANIRDAAERRSQRITNSRTDNQTTFNPICDTGFFPVSRSLPSKLRYTCEPPLLATSDLPDTSEMDTLFQSIQNGYEDGSLDGTVRSLVLDNEYLATQQAQLRALASTSLLSSNPLPVALPRGHTQARNGFTPAEKLVLEAHEQRLQLQAQLSRSSPAFNESISTSRKPNATARSFGSASLEPFQASGLVGKGVFYHDTLPMISEDDFHAMGHPTRSFAPTFHEFQGVVGSCPSTISGTTSTVFVRPPSRAVSIVPPPPDYEEPGKRPKGQHQHVERSVESKQVPCPSSSFDNYQSISSGGIKRHAALLQAPTRSNDISSSGNANNSNPGIICCDKNAEIQPSYLYSHDDVRSRSEEDKRLRFHPSPAPHVYTKKSPNLGEHHSTDREELKSPAVVSPALTYSSRTSSTLSPATPFFGSFTGSQEAFEVITMENENVAERKLKGRVAHN